MIVRHSIDVMGTVASMAASDHRATRDDIQAAFHAAAKVLQEMDQRFSHYQPTSAISRFQLGEQVDPLDERDIHFVLDQCANWERRTDGAFRATDPRSGVLDTAGLVKGLAIERAVEAMVQACPDVLLNLGGDILARGNASQERPWRTAIRGLHDPNDVHEIVELRNQGIATSALYERGDHIWPLDPAVRPPGSVSVIGQSMVTADVLATAAFAAGRASSGFLTSYPDYRVIWQ